MAEPRDDDKEQEWLDVEGTLDEYQVLRDDERQELLGPEDLEDDEYPWWLG